MKPSVLGIVCLLSLGSSLVIGENAERKEDSYLNALHDVNGKHNEFVPGAIPDNFGATYPSAGYDYKPVYGHPSPTPVYGPPKPTYGPPHPQFPHHHHHHVYPVYGPLPTQAPRGDWLWDKFHLKFDLFTLGKILLKLLIFKKIVKFIGVICLLMFLPTLIEKKHNQADETDAFDQGGMFRNLKPIDDTARFNELTSFVLTSIESFADKQKRDSKCTSGELTCRFSRMLNTIDRNYPWKRVSKWVRSNEVSVAQKVLPQSENPLESLDELSSSNSDDASMA